MSDNFEDRVEAQLLRTGEPRALAAPTPVSNLSGPTYEIWGEVRRASDGDLAVFSPRYNAVKARFTAGNSQGWKVGDKLYRLSATATEGEPQVDGGDIGRAFKALRDQHPDKFRSALAKPSLQKWFVGQIMGKFPGRATEAYVSDLVEVLFDASAPTPATRASE